MFSNNGCAFESINNGGGSCVFAILNKKYKVIHGASSTRTPFYLYDENYNLIMSGGVNASFDISSYNATYLRLNTSNTALRSTTYSISK